MLASARQQSFGADLILQKCVEQMHHHIIMIIQYHILWYIGSLYIYIYISYIMIYRIIIYIYIYIIYYDISDHYIYIYHILWYIGSLYIYIYIYIIYHILWYIIMIYHNDISLWYIIIYHSSYMHKMSVKYLIAHCSLRWVVRCSEIGREVVELPPGSDEHCGEFQWEIYKPLLL